MIEVLWMGLWSVIGMTVGFFYATRRVKTNVRKDVKHQCSSHLRREAEKLYDLEKRASSAKTKSEARKAAHLYASAAMQIEELEVI